MMVAKSLAVAQCQDEAYKVCEYARRGLCDRRFSKCVEEVANTDVNGALATPEKSA